VYLSSRSSVMGTSLSLAGEPERVASSASDATVRNAKHAGVRLRRARAGEVRVRTLYELKAASGRHETTGLHSSTFTETGAGR
jgi:hypothetical protein